MNLYLALYLIGVPLFITISMAILELDFISEENAFLAFVFGVLWPLAIIVGFLSALARIVTCPGKWIADRIIRNEILTSIKVP